MTTTLKATGDFHVGPAPTITISSGRGNTPTPEIHIILRDESDDASRTVMGWFDRDELLEAINKADRTVRRLIETGEPA